ncbi:MAG: alpha/beta hydrolase [Propionibacteriaceae bacterium]|nr:alpha/beta hydrolase [Propionibacteriaceae bacterium]
MQPDRNTIDLDWGTVSYLTWQPTAPPVGPPVVLLHGGGVDNAWLSWGRLGASLAEAGHRVYAPDHPGYGDSPLPPWQHTQERLVAYVGEVLDALGLDEVVLGGLSLGGGLTLGHALEHPDRVRRLMLFGSYGLADHQMDGPAAKVGNALSWALVRTGAMERIMRGAGTNRRLMRMSLRDIVRNPAEFTPELFDAVLAETTRPDAFTAFGQWQRDQILPGRLRTNYAPRLGEIHQPTLIVHGTHDSGVPVARAREAAAALPDATLLVVDGAGHWVQRDRPDIVEPVVLDFLSGDQIRR